MNNKVFRVSSIVRRFADDHSHGKKLFKALKMSDKRISVNVENSNGYFEKVNVEIGKSLYEGLKQSNVEMGGFCVQQDYYNLREKPVEPNANEPYCRSCLVEIERPVFDKLQVHQLEDNILETEDDLGFDETRRLSCCITVEPWMNEMKIRIPILLPNSENHINRE